MIQVDQALHIIQENSFKMRAVKLKVNKALGFVLAETVFSPINMPPFRQSAMDGYAFVQGEDEYYKVIGGIQAGSHSDPHLQENEAIRIFTGAYVPNHADTVVMQEHVKREEDLITIEKMPQKGANIRAKGEQVEKGALVLEKDTVLSPAAIGYLACLGIIDVLVYQQPKVAILVTGSELIEPGKKLKKGKIFESNSVMLQAALISIGIRKTKVFRVKDKLKSTKKAIKKLLSNFDVILISGGISVGDYDFVKEALVKNDVEELFYKINQKPGKPLFFGKKGEKLVFALPGNPASSLTSFYVYVLPALKKRMGFEEIHQTEILRKSNATIQNPNGKTLFLKGLYDGTHVTVLESQSSAMLNTFAIANCLVVVPYDTTQIRKNQFVRLLPLN
ncbi:molybdopterin molybdotransferase MoeA [Flavobacterium agrisoli]|uniref:Molybdopterin molybdenumtransferase n=1 Tax=Flavobacterium agrisoli TaxID=2793066 RepID=A0A934UIN4_9FLAO|nr:gephyrin-like molybdotransferase Glp [Flavobacterium agrisoli]MBK0368565.1 molybdopterin molybdotransferase MoeA [Flavobacterium agrisoli]